MVDAETNQKMRRLIISEQNSLERFIETAERFGISETATAPIYYESNRGINAVHKYKEKARMSKIRQFEGFKPSAVGFDERQDITTSWEYIQSQFSTKNLYFQRCQ